MARGGIRKTMAVSTAALTAVSIMALPGEHPTGSPGRPGWLAGLEATSTSVAAIPWQESSSAPAQRDTPSPVAEFAFPEPVRWDVTLGRAGSEDGRPVRVTARSTQARGESLRVEVLDRAAARRLGASGFVFTVSSVNTGPKRSLPVEVSVDYSRFAHAYGAGYADRLRVVALRPCALARPAPAGCPTARTAVPARNDRSARTLVVDANLAEPTAFAVVSAAGGDEGTFAASPLSITGTWQVSPGSGEFRYSYPIDVPAPPGGSPPTVGLSYSSGAIDGLTIGSNTQASPTGLGWSDFANAFIERRYVPCVNSNPPTMDLCWGTDNATISLGGVSGPLLPVNAGHTEWRAQADPGWRIQRLTGAMYTDIYQQQYWKVTGPDGTQYLFGSGHMPGQQTNAILSVPVTADHSGEPCRKPGDLYGVCAQGWRWYLDRVIDPDQNVQSYVYERQENWYAAALGIGGHIGNAPYHRAAMLKAVYYGGRDWDPNQYAARVTFDLQWRCGFLVKECPAATAEHSGFPDVPTDLICARNAPCTNYAPAFFNARRYASVRTEVRIGSAWKGVAQHLLSHSFNANSLGVAAKLQLEGITRAGVAFGASTEDPPTKRYPPTAFGYTWMNNRVDHEGSIPKAMRHNRLIKITNPFGGTTTVTYGVNRGCDLDYVRRPAPHWDRNLRDCFPQSIKDGAHLGRGAFHKYLVMKVVENAGQGSPPMETSYAYEDDPAWAFDSGAFARDEDELGWSLWRGYGTVLITQGPSKTRLRMFRGWDGDQALEMVNGEWVPTRTREESVRTIDGPARYPDSPALAGRVLEERRLGVRDGVPDSVLESRVHEYTKRTTFDLGSDFRFSPEWVGLAITTETVFSSATVSRQRRSLTTYNHDSDPTRPAQPATTYEEGWLHVTGDERCTITTYADNPGANMFVFPATNTRVAGGCGSTQVLTRAETYYDGLATLGAPPTRGNPTRVRTQIDGGRWAETVTEYDDIGRPVRVTDPTGASTTTAYGVTAGAWAGQIPTRTTVTNALGHALVTDFHPEFGVPKRDADVNGNVTDYWYDEFGRLTAVWLPTEPLAFAEPSYKFSYDIPNRSVRTQRLVSEVRTGPDLVFEDTWVIHDGFWRERQVQGVSPAAGKVLVAETTYDNRGLVRDETVEQAITGTPGRYLSGGTSWLNRTRHSYDELGREVRNEWLRTDVVARATETEYGLDTVTVTGPDDRRVRERVDGLARTVAVAEYDGQGWATSTYEHDLADRLRAVTDPAGNRITYTTNLAGWRTGQQDPNRGGATFTYDDAGRQISATDARGNRIHTVYDRLGRAIERRSGSATGPRLASWTYDTATGGKGQLHRETTHTAGGDWVNEVLGYDTKGRPTGSRLTVPAGIPGLSGAYTVSQTYDRADRIRTTRYPAMGGLPEETVTTDYNNLGLPTRLAGLAEYVWNASYDDRGRRLSAGLGPRPGGNTWMARSWTYNVDQQVNGAETFIAGAGVVSDHELVFDRTGNLTENLTRRNGLTWLECFGYDRRNRLTAAHTVAATTSCADGTPGTGDRPYAHTYEYSADGKLLARVEDGTRTDYAYPAAGAPRPHAPTRVGADAYTWDPGGNLSARTVGGRTESYTWNVEGRLQSVGAAGDSTSFVYDPAGQRLLRRTPDGRNTLYVAGHELTVDAAGTPVTAVRPYTFDDQLVATRTLTGVEYLVTDASGSVELAAPAGGSPSATRTYAPYGRVRSQTGDPATDRGFVGQVEDASTGLSYLNARYYDTAIGVFVSADPVYDTSKVKTLNPYGYSNGNPTSHADPSGLSSAYTFGLELENSKLRAQNRELIAHIGRLGSHIEDLQDIIRKQQKHINRMLGYIDALEAEIARQASIIRRLQARIAYLERVVAYQQRVISRLRHIIARQQRYIRYQAGIIGYQRGVIARLSVRIAAGLGAAAGAVAGRSAGGTRSAPVVIRGIGKALPQSDCDRDWISLACAGQGARDVTRWPTGGAGVAWSWAADLAGGDPHRCGDNARCVSGSWLIVPWATGGTLGDAIVCRDECTEEFVDHEMVHVGQFEDGGIAYPVAYGWESIFGGIGCGNKYERPAYEAGLDCPD
jgi:RHS repeat-associated protein